MTVERVATHSGDRVAEITAILRYYLANPEKLSGLMIIAERKDTGALEVKYSGAESVIQRLGNLQKQMRDMIENYVSALDKTRG